LQEADSTFQLQEDPSHHFPPVLGGGLGGCSLVRTTSAEKERGEKRKGSPLGVCKYLMMLYDGGNFLGGARWKHPTGCIQSTSCQMEKSGCNNTSAVKME